jgi:hypothetical protein
MRKKTKETDAELRRYLLCPKANYVHTARKRALMNWAHGNRPLRWAENAVRGPKPDANLISK